MSLLTTITELVSHFDYFSNDSLVRLFCRVVDYDAKNGCVIVEELEPLFVDTEIVGLDYGNNFDPLGQASSSLEKADFRSLPLAYAYISFTDDNGLEQVMTSNRGIFESGKAAQDQLVVNIMGKLSGLGHLSKPSTVQPVYDTVDDNGKNKASAQQQFVYKSQSLKQPSLAVLGHTETNKVPVIKLLLYTISILENQTLFDDENHARSVLKMAVMNRENARIRKIQMRGNDQINHV